MKINCTVITPRIEELARKIGKSNAYTCNLVSVWQTQNNSAEYPVADSLKQMLKDGENEKRDIFLAIPVYEKEEFDASKPLASTTKEGKIILRKLPEKNSREYFFNYITGKINNSSSEQKKKVFEILDNKGYRIEELEDILQSTTEMYQFLLWHEMSHLQHSDKNSYWNNGKDLLTQDKLDLEVRATIEAWEKAKEWRKRNPIKTSSIESATKPIVQDNSTITSQLLSHLKSIGINIHNREEMIQYLKKHSAESIQEAIAIQKEMDDIKAKAIADGTFMKAPNGEKSNLNEKQWLQVRTKNFINWFGDWINDLANASKVVDENGEPLIVYHGSLNTNITVFNRGFTDNYEESGIFFTSDRKYAQSIIALKQAVTKDKGKKDVYQVFLNIRNPKTLEEPLVHKSVSEQRVHDLLNAHENKTKAPDGYLGHDSYKGWKTDAVSWKNIIRKSKGIEFAIFNPNQIKSATDNNGMFSTENDNIQTYTTSQGEIYGFATSKGELYFDETVISPEHPIHEYTHLWDKTVAKNNPKLWQRGIALMKEIPLWKEIEEDANYGKKWKNAGITDSKLEFFIASEVHSRLTGTEGEKLLNKIAEEKNSKNIIEKLKQWLLEFWKELKATFSNWSQEDLDNLTLQDFTRMTIKDLVEGFNPNELNIDLAKPSVREQFFKEMFGAEFEGGGSFFANFDGLKGLSKEEMTKLDTAMYEGTPIDAELLNTVLLEMKRVNPEEYNKAKEEFRQRHSQSQQAQPAQQQVLTSSYEEDIQQQPTVEEVEAQRESENVNKVPEIGTNVLSINYNNPLARLVRDFDPIQRHDRAVMLARKFSDIVSNSVQERVRKNVAAMNKEMSKKSPNQGELMRLNEEAQLYNDSTLGRRAVIMDKTLPKIFQEMKDEIKSYLEMSVEELEEDFGKGKGQYMLDAYQKVLNNWDLLLEEACNIIEGAENIRIVIDKHDYNTGKETKKVLGGNIHPTEDEAKKDEDDTDDDEGGKRVDGNGGWSFKIRFVDPRASLARRVRSVISNIARKKEDGTFETDDLGNIRYLDGEFVHSALINELSGMIDSDDFSYEDSKGVYHFPALEKVAQKYDWANQVINELQGNSSLISEFYTDFRKDFVPYWIQYFDEADQVWKTKALNQAVAFDSTKMSIINNYEQGFAIDDNSIYDINKKISTENASVGLNLANEILSLLRDFYDEDFDQIIDSVAKMLRMVGLDANKHVISSLLKSPEGQNDVTDVVNALKNIFEGIPDLAEGSHLIDRFSDAYNTIAEKVGLVSELENVQSFRLGDKSYYSYAAPNYTDTMFKIFKDDSRRDEYLQNQFGKYKWFKNKGEWMNEWLKLIESDENVRYMMATKEVLQIGKTEYENWRPAQIKSAFIREYFSHPFDPDSKDQYAWYNMPIFSDSPIVKFIRFKRYVTDEEGSFKSKLLPLFRKVVKQELYRIRLVQDREAAGVATITNFDKNGKKFCFFPELNNGSFLDDCMEMWEKENTKGLNDLIDVHINELMNRLFANFLNTDNEFLENTTKDLIAQRIVADKLGTIQALEEYFWNQAFASIQIIQLTTTDLAYYKDATDFQKRYKEVYAAGLKLNTNSQYGKKVEKTLYLKDIVRTSASYQDIKKVLNEAVKAGHIQSFDRDAILNMFKKVNFADAQAYRSLDSMRAVLDMMGKWTPEMEESFKRFEEGEWDMADFNRVWQTIKPFVFTQIEKPDGLGGSIKVPHQNKNSEYLLLAMYPMIAAATSKSQKLRAVNKFMKDNDIDVIQFESAVKVGKQRVIDISYSEDKLNSWINNNKDSYEKIQEAAKKVLGKEFEKASDFDIFKAGNDYLMDEDIINQDEYNERFDAIEPSEEEVYKILNSLSKENREFKPEVVHEIPYEDYVVQQPTPEHLFDHEAVFGSQFRNLIIADLPDDPDFRINVNGKLMTKQEVANLYKALIVENLLEDSDKVENKFDNIETLQKALLEIIKGNPRFGRDMVDALQIVEVMNPLTNKLEKTFNIPLDNPTTTAKIQEIVSSMFKNGISKQYINGGSCIMVSSVGLTKELQILYNEDGGIKGLECYLPAYSKKFYEPFLVTRTTPDGKEYQELDIERLPEELRKIIGYRIPTEDKYSMAPLIIKGFLPQQNGSAIMLPAEITTIAGSDFDVDKMFLMIPEYDVSEKAKYYLEKAVNDYARITSDSSVFTLLTRVFKDNVNLTEALSETPDFYEWLKEHREEYPFVSKVEYNYDKSPQDLVNNRRARNNALIDIAWGILTNADTAEKILNPGNFDKAKIAARISVIINDPKLVKAFAEKNGISTKNSSYFTKVRNLLLKMSKNEELEALSEFVEKNRPQRSQLTVDTFVYNHQQNMTGGSLIGTYANNTSMQAKYQYTDLAIKNDYTFILNGRKVQSLHDIFSPLGERISKNCANFSAASVDNVKDPVLADLLQNKSTAPITGFMLRAGLSIEEIGLLFSQPIIRKVNGNFKELQKEINRLREELKAHGGRVNMNINLHNFTREELLDNILQEYRKDEMQQQEYNSLLASQIQAALLLERCAIIASELNDLTKISRSDSPKNGAAISIAGIKEQVNNVSVYNESTKNEYFHLTGMQGIPQNDFLNSNMSKDQKREKLLKSKMPILQAFYTLGIENSTKVMGEYFSQVNPYSDSLLKQVYDNSARGVDTSIMQLLYDGIIRFALSKTKLFGDSDEGSYIEKKDYYLKKFPSKYLEIIAKNPDIANLGIIKKLTIDDNGALVMKRSGRLTPRMRETLMRDFDTLLYMNNPEAQKLAIDLFMYAYYKDGFKFGPNNFGIFFSTNFITSFPEIVNTLRTFKYGMKEGNYFDKYLPQFYANYAELYSLVPSIDSMPGFTYEAPDGELIINSEVCFNSRIKKSHKYVLYEGNLYLLKSEGTEVSTYEPSILFPGVETLYNANRNAGELLEEIKKQNSKVKEEDSSTSKSNTALKKRALSTTDDTDFSFLDADNSFPDSGNYDSMDNALSMLENEQMYISTNTHPINDDVYDEEDGQAQLDEPLCE